ncbi:alpha/beta hydrolase [Actinosynnema sp. NPDC020468]|uniref:alpha/beta fold hydrolase n=1 Tax=Actinosynnema sp. NPDC020468 TaxID=3154488 RepID=UPI0033C7BB00
MDECEVIADDGTRIWATAVGTGKPVLLCHGGPGLWDMFDGLPDALARRHRLIRWDQRGGGRSDRVGPYTMARTIADLDAVRRHFGAATTALLGHSWGATVALHYALAHPDRVDALVYVAGTGLGDGWREEFHRNLAERHTGGFDGTRESAISLWSADFADRERARESAEAMATPWFEVGREAGAALNAESRAWSEADLVARCRELRVPTLIVDGADDVRPRWAVDSLAAALPVVDRVVLPAGHLPWVEQPAAFSRAVLAHLA